MRFGRPARTFFTLALTMLAPLVAVAPAQAALGGAGSCQLSAVSEPFAVFGDPTTYELVPGGDFAGTLGGWSVQGGAGLTSTGSTDVLSLPDDAIATSPQACVNVVHPTIRFYARSATPGTTVDVAALLATPAGTVAIPTGAVAPTPNLAPTQQLAVRVPLLAAPAAGVMVGLRFEARGGTAQVDHVYVDPWRSG